MDKVTIWTGRAITLARPAAYVWMTVLALQNLVVIATASGSPAYEGKVVELDAGVSLPQIAIAAALVRLVLLMAAAVLVWLGRSRFWLAAVIILIVFPISAVLQRVTEHPAFLQSPLWALPLINLSALFSYAVAALLVFVALRAPAHAEASLNSLASGFD